MTFLVLLVGYIFGYIPLVASCPLDSMPSDHGLCPLYPMPSDHGLYYTGQREYVHMGFECRYLGQEVTDLYVSIYVPPTPLLKMSLLTCFLAYSVFFHSFIHSIVNRLQNTEYKFRHSIPPPTTSATMKERMKWMHLSTNFEPKYVYLRIHITEMCSGITLRMLSWELYAQILQKWIYSEDWREIFMKQSVNKCR